MPNYDKILPMRNFVYPLLAFAMLFMGIERAWDIGNETTPGIPPEPASVQLSLTDNANPEPASVDDGPCEHICHAMSYGITAGCEEIFILNGSQSYALAKADWSSLSQAPPTPPPTA